MSDSSIVIKQKRFQTIVCPALENLKQSKYGDRRKNKQTAVQSHTGLPEEQPNDIF